MAPARDHPPLPIIALEVVLIVLMPTRLPTSITLRISRNRRALRRVPDITQQHLRHEPGGVVCLGRRPTALSTALRRLEQREAARRPDVDGPVVAAGGEHEGV